MRLPRSMDSGFRQKRTTNHNLDLLPESLVYQSIHKRVYGRVEHDHRVGNRVHGGAKALTVEMAHDVHYGVCDPTDPEDDADNYDGQGYSLP